MGLELKASKTRVGHTLREVGGRAGFDFLGFTVRQFPAGAATSTRDCQGRPLGFLTLIKPSREAVRRQVGSLREIVAGHTGAPQVALIRRLNPVIRGWSNYFCYGTRGEAFRSIDHYVTERVRAFLARRHKVQGRGNRRFTFDVIHGERGVLGLERLPRAAPSWALR